MGCQTFFPPTFGKESRPKYQRALSCRTASRPPLAAQDSSYSGLLKTQSANWNEISRALWVDAVGGTKNNIRSWTQEKNRQIKAKWRDKKYKCEISLNMKGFILVLCTLFLFWADGQKRTPKRIRTSGRLLGRPDPVKCSRRPRQLQQSSSGHYYFISEETNFKVSLIFYIQCKYLQGLKIIIQGI